MTETVTSANFIAQVGDAGGAIFSHCMRYRYLLRRGMILELAQRPAIFCMLTPSKADADHDDASSRRVIGFTRAWECDSSIIVNAYALRSTNPRGLREVDDPVGPMNDYQLRRVARQSHFAPFGIVCAWGKHAKRERVDQVIAIFREAGARLTCLAQCADGTPKHPLYLRGDLKPREYVHHRSE
jgi:hypothetical protein